jgi:hypothetical protein
MFFKLKNPNPNFEGPLVTLRRMYPRRLDFFCYFFLSRKKSKSTLLQKEFQIYITKFYFTKSKPKCNVINHLTYNLEIIYFDRKRYRMGAYDFLSIN